MGALALLATVVLAGCSATTNSRPVSALLTPAPFPVGAVENQAPSAIPDVAHGAAIYAVKCLGCHGETGQANGPQAAQIRARGGQVARLAGSEVSQNATPAKWFDVIGNGRIDKLMPGFGQSLTPQNRWDVLSYVWSLALPTQTLQLAQSTYAEQCLACHGAAGKGDGPDAGAYGLRSFAEAKWGLNLSLNDIAAAMTAGAAHSKLQLDEPQRLVLASYVRSFAYHPAESGLVALSPASGDGVLSLQAVNRTPNGGPVTGLPVALHTYNTSGEVFSRTAVIDRDGMVTFGQLPRDPALFYQADVIYNGARFYAPAMQFSGTLQISDTLAVFEVTNDPGVITLAGFHYFVQQVNEGSLSVVEYYSFDNLSDRAYINRQSTATALRSLQISVPAEATDISFDGPGLGARFFQDGETIYDSDAVPPGQATATIAMIYNLPYRGGRDITREMSYPVQNWDVLIPDGELRVTGLQDNGVQPFHTSSIRIYVPERPGLQKGERLSFTLTGQPRAASTPGADSTAVLAGAAVFSLTAALGAILIFTRLRRARAGGY